jgi:hypothetical protein
MYIEYGMPISYHIACWCPRQLLLLTAQVSLSSSLGKEKGQRGAVKKKGRIVPPKHQRQIINSRCIHACSCSVSSVQASSCSYGEKNCQQFTCVHPAGFVLLKRESPEPSSAFAAIRFRAVDWGLWSILISQRRHFCCCSFGPSRPTDSAHKFRAPDTTATWFEAQNALVARGQS